MKEYLDNAPVKTTYYSGLYEEVVFEGGNHTKKINYITGVDGLTAVYIEEGQNENMYYVAKDHLGSITHLINPDGTVAAEYSYDPWGRRRKSSDWLDYNVAPFSIINRGYTGHEHLEFFGLINMNGRIYDPISARFTTPDPFLQNPGFSQDFNRYSYVNNNPLKYNDPSGYNYGTGGNGRGFWAQLKYHYKMWLLKIPKENVNYSSYVDLVDFFLSSIFLTAPTLESGGGGGGNSDIGAPGGIQLLGSGLPPNGSSDFQKPKYKLNLVPNPPVNDVMLARYRNGGQIQWVSQNYLISLSSKKDAWAINLFNKINSELTFTPNVIPSGIGEGSYNDAVSSYYDSKSSKINHPAPTVSKITGYATLSYNNLVEGTSFDLKNNGNSFSTSFGPSSDVVYFDFNKGDILTTVLSRVQPQYGNLYVPPIIDFSFVNDTYRYDAVVASGFGYTLSVPVIR